MDRIVDGSIASSFRGTFNMPPVCAAVVLITITTMVILEGGTAMGILSVIIPVVTIYCFTVAVFVVVGGVNVVPSIFSEVFRRTFNVERITTKNFKTILVGNMGENLFSGRTNSNSTPYTTTTTRYSAPMGTKLARTLNMFVSAVIVYDYATVVVLATPRGVITKGRNVSLLRSTVECRLKSFKIVFVTIALFLFDFSAFLNVLFCTEDGITCLFKSG